ncbi:alpha/beta fold hydrolase [Nocardia sp. SYP-A9097]|uniref:alpha/beta fold hydrolase n=1 Tax=Nocardia sp. SYP-A9097 TaxID=2663237 RepID=UPI00129A968A|nr:alpha/beta hydrolase [Nocardia sp. SYP-A9097]MRH92175.1 alpha/beta fold hydrolase [Nocardia sp. SYP-A9097]
MVNILLVHGAIADGSSWERVIPQLQDAGHYVVAIQQPLSSIPDDVTKVRQALDQLRGPTVVVGHSFGGCVITNAAHGAPNVKSLVYVAAFAPDEGETVVEHAPQFPPLESTKHFLVDAQGRLTLPQDDFVRYFADDVDPVRARVMAAVQGPSDAARFQFVSGPPAWREFPSWFVVAGNDQIIGAPLEQWLAERMGAKTTTVAGASHAVMVSNPDAVTTVILEAAG